MKNLIVECYDSALEELGLARTEPITALALGVSLSMLRRYASGKRRPPLTVMLLLRCYQLEPLLLEILLKRQPGDATNINNMTGYNFLKEAPVAAIGSPLD